MINKKNLIKVNKMFGSRLYHASNLDFDVDAANRHKNVFRRVAQATRAMTSGHAFSDANKRTALVMIQAELAECGIKCNHQKLVKTLIRLANSHESSINIIERRIRKACNKKLTK